MRIVFLFLFFTIGCYSYSSEDILTQEMTQSGLHQSYYMGSNSTHHFFWIGDKFNVSVGHTKKVLKSKYNVPVEYPYTSNRVNWTFHKSTSIRFNRNFKLKEFKTHKRSVHQWSRPIPPQIIED